MAAAEVGEPSGMESYLARVRSRYEIGEQEALETAAAPMDAQSEESFQLSLFELMVDYKLDEGFKATPGELRRAALDLAIDHRLGQNFPEERRKALWKVQQKVERRRLWLAAKYLLGHLFGRRRPPVEGAGRLAGWMVEHFAEVLDRRELESFFGPEAEEPTLPYDPAGHSADR